MLLVGAWRLPRAEVLALPALAVLGFVWASMLAQQRLLQVLDPALEGRDLELTGVAPACRATSPTACASTSRSTRRASAASRS
ncbi:MAG: hypothetical protein MUE62_11450, partial [Burkholderiaceae bacterium]|nr:hypothetical protein [Burkholderiaceae bacterium]